MRLEPNPNYTGSDKPTIAAVTVDFIKEDSVAKLKFDNNELDDTLIPTADVQNIKKDSKYKDFYNETAVGRSSWLAFNMGALKDKADTPFAKNLKLRQAFSYALDRQLITDGALQGQGVPSTVLIPDSFLGYKKLDTYPFNPEKAKSMLKEAGYDTPEKVKALEDYINNYGPGGNSGGLAFNADKSANVAWMTSVQQQLKANLGLNIKLNPLPDSKSLFKRRDNDHEFLLVRGSWGQDFPDPQNFYEPLFTSLTNSGGNESNYSNPAYDAVVKKGNTATTPAQRAEFYQQAEKILQDDAAYVPLFIDIDIRLVRKTTIQNYTYNGGGPTQWKYMTIKK